ncbi:MAG: cysteine--tRNA ligase [Candidatus Sumerlaeaceae bacterium]|nr:cysteine--tRNA ligase [Candidatus Sumerlaeaceae bacterium]
MKIYNTATRRKEDFQPQNPPQVTMYNCGPTVYDYFHVGNARNFVVVDAVRRYLEHSGYTVKFVQNFTDVDDKIIKRANEKNEPWDRLAARFVDAYYEKADALAVRRATIHPKATEHIKEMLDLVVKLVEKGLAYEKNGDVYYRVRAFKGYGELSGKNIDDLLEGARVDVGELKEDPLDFALWKAAKPGEPSWTSPWGEGRPGWHLECSAMSMHHLGETIDIHSGGHDLIFPHHENERAQSCGATEKPFAKYWLHNGFLTINTEKMSKSLGNFFTINEVLDRFQPAAVRFYLLSAHYRHPLDYSDAALEEATNAVGRIREAVVTAEKILGGAVAGTTSDEAVRLEAEFKEAMDDDFNTQRAIGVIFEAVSLLNEKRQAYSRNANGESDKMAADALVGAIRRLLGILGLEDLIFSAGAADADGAFSEGLVDLLIRARKMAKEAKQFQLADYIRDELNSLGVRLQDHPTGTIWLKD